MEFRNKFSLVAQAATLGNFLNLHKCKMAVARSIYNSVVTCRCIAINSSASAPLNTKKIAVKKLSDVDVVKLGLEL